MTLRYARARIAAVAAALAVGACALACGPSSSYDGRFCGTVLRSDLVGPLAAVYFSKAPDAWDLRPERIGVRPNRALAEH